MALLSSLWHSTRDIVESNVNPEEAEILSGLLSSMPWDLQNNLQEHTMLHLDSLENGSDNMCLRCPMSSVLALC